MKRRVAHRANLHVAGQHDVLLAFDVEFERGCGEVALEDLLPQRVVFEIDGLWRLAVAVDDGWYISVAACLACGPLACTRARRCLERDKL